MSDDLHVTAASLPASIVATSYLEMRDQAQQRWFWWVSDAGNLVSSRTQPQGISLASRLAFYWLRWQSPSGLMRWIYPSLIGSPTVRSGPLSVGEGTSKTWPWWWSPSRKRWAMTLSDQGSILLTGTGEVITSPTVGFWRCTRCSWVGDVDPSNARRRDCEPQLNRCPRDGTILWQEEDEEWE